MAHGLSSRSHGARVGDSSLTTSTYMRSSLLLDA